MPQYRLIVSTDRFVPWRVRGAGCCCGCRLLLSQGTVAWVHTDDEAASEVGTLYCTGCLFRPSLGASLDRIEKVQDA